MLTQSDIDTFWARAHRFSYPGVVIAPAPKIKPASMAGPVPSDEDIPLALSSRRARTAKSNVDARSLRSSGKAKASGSRSKYVVSDDESESAVEIISAPKTSSLQSPTYSGRNPVNSRNSAEWNFSSTAC